MVGNDKLVLLYGLTEDEINVFKMSNLNYKNITEEIADMKIKEIISGENKVCAKRKLPQEKVILFNNFSDNELDKIIKLIRATIGKSPVLAVVTETSSNWTFSYLVEHLLEEREWYKNMEKGRNKSE